MYFGCQQEMSGLAEKGRPHFCNNWLLTTLHINTPMGLLLFSATVHSDTVAMSPTA